MIKEYKDFPLNEISVIGIGGKAKSYFYTGCIKDIISKLNELYDKNLKYKIIGNTSNILFDDMGFNGSIIKFTKENVIIKNDYIIIYSGARLSKANQILKEQNLGGLEYFVSIPANIGGAIVNNLSCFNHSISDNIISVRVYDIDNKKIKILKKEKCQFKYRNSLFKNKNYLIISVKFKKIKKSKESIIKLTKKYLKLKSSTQPLNEKSLGSVFLNGKNYHSAKLIDNLNLKGFKIGGAMISNLHSNFIINFNNATSSDYKNLISYIYNKVKKTYNIELHPEIEFLDY